MRRILAAIALVLLGSAAHGAASAQQPGRIYKIGMLTLGTPGFVPQPVESWTGPFATMRDTLRDAGFVVGKNLVFERRNAQGDGTRFAKEAEALVAANVDVIMTNGTPPTVAAAQATKSIPIVFWGVGDPVEKGIVASLARPGGNVTGMAVMIAFQKQWQLLHDMAPAVRLAAFMGNATNRPSGDRQATFEAFMVERMKADAAAVGIEAIRARVATLGDVEKWFAVMAAEGPAGVLIVNDALLVSPEWRPVMLNLALQYRLPTSCAQSREWADSGCLVTYVEDWHSIQRGAALQVIKILRGTAPVDVPVEQPTDYKVIINAKTAKALDLAIPLSLLAMADEVIE